VYVLCYAGESGVGNVASYEVASGAENVLRPLIVVRLVGKITFISLRNRTYFPVYQLCRELQPHFLSLGHISMSEESTFPITPLRFNVIVHLEDNTETASGIVLPDSDPQPIGVVKASGDCVTLVKPGDKVMLHPYDFFEHEVDGTMYAFTEEKHIIAVFHED
jgi:co-chaperonin GroES (HSP10)